jgi:hypothetical protein
MAKLFPAPDIPVTTTKVIEAGMSDDRLDQPGTAGATPPA